MSSPPRTGREGQRHAVLSEPALSQGHDVLGRRRQGDHPASAQARAIIIKACAARGPGPQATTSRIWALLLSSSGRQARTTSRINSITLSPTGICRKRVCAAINSSPENTASTPAASSAPVVAKRISRSVSRSGIRHVDLYEEAVKLGLWQRIGALLFNRVLRCEHVEGRIQARDLRPTTVTLRSCIACNRADCVRGLARLISSAIKS